MNILPEKDQWLNHMAQLYEFVGKSPPECTVTSFLELTVRAQPGMEALNLGTGVGIRITLDPNEIAKWRLENAAKNGVKVSQTPRGEFRELPEG